MVRGCRAVSEGPREGLINGGGGREAVVLEEH